MNPYKLIAFDMDGTFLNSKKEVEESTRKAVKDAAAAGKTVVINTGRSGPEIAPFFHLVPEVHYFISCNGSVLLDAWENKVVSQQCIAADTVEQLLQLSLADDIMVNFLCADRSIVQADKLAHIEDYSMGGYKEGFTSVCTQVDDIIAWFRAAPFEIPKVNFYHSCPEARARSKARTAHVRATAAYAESASLEFTAEGVNKKTGLLRLGETLGIRPEEMIAVGDSDNDLTMLEAVGLAVAMGNSFPAVLEIADVTVADCDHGGCAEAVYNYLLK